MQYLVQYLIKVTNNSLLTVLAGVLLTAVVMRFSRGRKAFPACLMWGAVCGLAAALVYAVLKRTTGYAVREYYNLGALLPSLAALLCMFPVLLPFAFRRAKTSDAAFEEPAGLLGASGAAKVHEAVFRFLAFFAAAAWVAYCLPDLFLFPFEFAVGMDTVFNTDFMYTVLGYLLGILLMLLTGAALYAVAGRLSGGVLLSSFAAGLLVMGAFQVLSVAQILLGRNLISRSRYRWLMGPVMWALNHANWFMYALMALSALLALLLYIYTKKTPLAGDNPAQVRKSRADARRRVRSCTGLMAGLLIALLSVTIGPSFADRKVELSPAEELPAVGGEIVIPFEKVNDGNLYRFVYKASDGTDVRYIVIKKSGAAYGVGLDACDVCGPTGYYQRKDQVICMLCDVVMNISTIGFPGGCNPVPLKYRSSDGGLVIAAQDLENEKRRFR
jgi:uncharacterized membrane protein